MMATKPYDPNEEVFTYDNSTQAGGVNVTQVVIDVLQNISTTSSRPNATTPPALMPERELYAQVIIAVVLTIMILGTIVGNCLVCIAVGIVKRLQSPSNLLIVSLAVADLSVALFVMPFAMVLEIKQSWIFGHTVCDLWTSLDVLLCTASILNLCMISVDRYFVITKPFQYAMKRTPKRMGIMILIVWVSSALISIPPVFGWKSPREQGQCFISQQIGYQIYATVGAFYLPLSVMIVVYFKIWRVSSRIAKEEEKSKFNRHPEAVTFQVGRPSHDSGDSRILPNGTVKDHNALDNDAEEILPKINNSKRRLTLRNILPKSHTKLTTSKERKATKTLGVIMGGFTACWLPFFILAVVRPFVAENGVPEWLSSVLMWLGYFNSFLNPVIYARFNRDFRNPFKEILCFRCRGINHRMRADSYVEQYGGPVPSYRDSLRPPAETVVRYNSHGETLVQIGNGSANGQRESKV